MFGGGEIKLGRTAIHTLHVFSPVSMNCNIEETSKAYGSKKIAQLLDAIQALAVQPVNSG